MVCGRCGNGGDKDCAPDRLWLLIVIQPTNSFDENQLVWMRRVDSLKTVSVIRNDIRTPPHLAAETLRAFTASIKQNASVYVCECG